MATQLGLYNAALLEIGDRGLATLDEDVEARRVLDLCYADTVTGCLEAGAWNFATRTIRADADPAITPAFGFAHVFAKPEDWVRTSAVSLDESFAVPLIRYVDDVDYWSAEATPIYVRYVSGDPSWGLDLTLWPRSFARYVELELAWRISERLTQNASKKELIGRDRDRAKRNALNKDALNEAQPKFAPVSSWTAARGVAAARERGGRGSLIG
jgi:hypothetical protein